MDTNAIRARLEQLRTEIRAERISYGEIAELQALAEHIDPSDVELLEWAGVPEHKDDEADYDQLTDRDNLIVAKEELETLYGYEQNNGDDATLHGLDTAITVLGKLIERLPNPDA